MSRKQNPEFELAPPPASSMIEALRGVGYSTETAIADLIDNSISAGANNVWINFWWAGRDSYVSTLDDGKGMNEDELFNAMRPGSRNPLDQRSAHDLGRFGLGLKTASFSQCRRLTVASRRNGRMATRRWDLDHVAQVDDWQLLTGPARGSETLIKPLEASEQGTLVLWECMDRVVGSSASSDRRSHDSFLRLIERVEQHLAMVFHRFLEGAPPHFCIFINGEDETQRVRAWDPFLRNHNATVPTPAERIVTPRGSVEIQGFVLPHKDRLTRKEFQIGAGPGGWTAQQGFYVYRNRRMLVSGNWLGFGLGRKWTKEEPYKLARLRLDIPNTADSDWRLDIKKSVAQPPSYLEYRLRDLADCVRRDARQVFAHRGTYGQRSPIPDLQRAWKAVEGRDAVLYRVDRDHPVVKRVLDQAGPLSEAVETMLRVLEETVPVQRIWLDTVEKGEFQKGAFADSPSADLETILLVLHRHLVETVGLTPDKAREQLLTTEPFQNFPELVENLPNYMDP